MTISLSKGQRIDLTKTNPGLTKVVVGLGWDTNKYSGGKDFDLDASAFLLHEDGKAKGADDFVFYNNPTGGAGSLTYSGITVQEKATGMTSRSLLISARFLPIFSVSGSR